MPIQILLPLGSVTLYTVINHSLFSFDLGITKEERRALVPGWGEKISENRAASLTTLTQETM